MSAPLIWILMPIAIAGIAAVFRIQRVQAILGGGFALLLAGIAQFVPIDRAIQIGQFGFKIAPDVEILGRRIAITPAESPLLVIVFGLVAMWLFGAEAAFAARRLVPLGLLITSLLVASIAVEPFLFAALLIEIAVLLSIPMLVPLNQTPGPGVIRFLIYQTLAMPFILLAGWLMAGVESSPGDLALAVQSATILGLGFAFLLAIFPLYTWMPVLAEEASPYIVGFLFWILPTITIIFGMGFLDRYSWLRTSSQLQPALQLAGLLMAVSGGIWCAFQRNLARQMAFAVIAETGFSLLALSLGSDKAVQATLYLLIPRSLALTVWALALVTLKRQASPLRFSVVKGLARLYPITSAGLVLAHLSVAGFPLLAGFPIRLALWEGLAGQSLGVAFWFLIGTLGILTGAIRALAVLVMAPQNSTWELRESWGPGLLIGLGVFGLFIMGVFPQAAQPFLVNLPSMFEHLGK